jgi:DNA-binding HxlR family transcriptional regulator
MSALALTASQKAISSASRGVQQAAIPGVVAQASGYRLTPRGAELIQALWPLMIWSEAWAADLGEANGS